GHDGLQVHLMGLRVGGQRGKMLDQVERFAIGRLPQQAGAFRDLALSLDRLWSATQSRQSPDQSAGGAAPRRSDRPGEMLCDASVLRIMPIRAESKSNSTHLGKAAWRVSG